MGKHLQLKLAQSKLFIIIIISKLDNN